MFISSAFAQSAQQAAETTAGFGESSLYTFIQLALIFLVFYLLLIRPQQRRIKQHKNMVENIRRGDEIVTAGGIVAKVIKVMDESNELIIEIAEGVRVKVLKSTVSTVLVGHSNDLPQPANEDKKQKHKK